MRIEVFDLGLVDFNIALQYQKDIFNKVKLGSLESVLIFCRHYPIITLGRLADKRNILTPDAQLKQNGIQISEAERGGDATYHGPGQLIIYPIFNLKYFKKDIHWFLRYLEKTIIDLLLDFEINAASRSGLTGVWIGEQKIASIGIAIKNWITFYGISLNIKKDDLRNFRFIRPCGMDIQMTSMESILTTDVEMDDVTKNLIEKFRLCFKVRE